MSVLLSTAYLDEAARCHEVILMHEGKRLGQGSPESFSEPMRGRTFHVTAPGLGKRTLQARLSAVPGIVDAIIEGEQVRIVTASAGLPDLSAVLADKDTLHMQSAEPIFEDAFIARLKGDKASDHMLQVSESQQAAIAAPENGAVIEARDLQRRFGQFYAVKGVSFSVVTGFRGAGRRGFGAVRVGWTGREGR